MKKSRKKWTLSGEGLTSEPVFGVRALTADDIGVVFQPIVEMASGKTFAYEALVRCKRDEYKSPPVLFEHAVNEGACGSLGRLIRDVAFGTCGAVPLFVNIHPDELSERWLVRPDDPLGYHANPVFLEITETATMTHFDLCKSVLKEVCERTRAHLVVDDFGAGYSNLDRLLHLETSVVKLDIALTKDIHRLPRKQTIARHMIELCKDLGARVVAEGVETLDELKCVRDIGAHYAQGYLLARPAAPPPPHAWPLATPASRTGLPPPLPKRQPPPLPPRAKSG